MAMNATQSDLVRKLLRHGPSERIERTLDKIHGADIATLVTRIGPVERARLVDVLLSVRRAAKTLRELPRELLTEVLAEIDNGRVATMISRLPPDDGLLFVSLLNQDRVPSVLDALPTELRRRLATLLRYPASSAGAVMTTDYLSFQSHETVAEALEELRKRGDLLEAIFYLYVVAVDGKLAGVVPLRKLVTSPPGRTLGDLMVPDPVKVSVLAGQEEAARTAHEYNLMAVPVVEDDGRLVGVITLDDVIEVLDRAATEDMFGIAGLSSDDHVFSPVLRSLKKRLPWMVLNMGTAFIASTVVRVFESSIARVVVLATLMPIVAGLGGNCGTQALTVMTRAIATGEIRFGSALAAIVKQVAVGLGLGAVMGVMAGGVSYLIEPNAYLSGVLFAAMTANMTIGALVGATVPLLLKLFGQDPAAGSGVLTTACTDTFGFLLFLGLATLVLPHL
jgi:magnesium transporter